MSDRRKPRIRVLLLALATCVPVVAGCRIVSRLEARQRALETERDALISYLEATEPTSAGGAYGSIVPFKDVLILLDEGLIRSMLEVGMPFHRELSGGITVRVDSADVALRPGFALVEMEGRVSLIDEDAVYADVTLSGALEIAPETELGTGITATIQLFGIEAKDVGVAGLTQPATRLVEEMARFRLSELSETFDDVPIPVRLDQQIMLPLVDAPGVTIPASELPLVFRLDAVRVLEEGIFISMLVDRTVPIWNFGNVQ